MFDIRRHRSTVPIAALLAALAVPASSAAAGPRACVVERPTVVLVERAHAPVCIDSPTVVTRVVEVPAYHPVEHRPRRGYERGYDRGYDDGYDRGYDRGRGRSYSHHAYRGSSFGSGFSVRIGSGDTRVFVGGSRGFGGHRGGFYDHGFYNRGFSRGGYYDRGYGRACR